LDRDELICRDLRGSDVRATFGPGSRAHGFLGATQRLGDLADRAALGSEAAEFPDLIVGPRLVVLARASRHGSALRQVTRDKE
jgi:hypothetical protein